MYALYTPKPPTISQIGLQRMTKAEIKEKKF